MAYRYYDAEKAIMGKKMKDWLKFAMACGTLSAQKVVTNSVAERNNSLEW